MSDNVKIGAEVELDPKSTQNIKTLKQQLRDALKEAQILSSQDLGSKEAIAAQKRVAALRDTIDDVNESVGAFTGAGQFKAIGNAVQGIAGGFAAAQGAIALFGGESEDLQKTLVRLNAAMAFSQGLSQIEGLKDSFGALGRMITTNILPALTTLKGALIATGIGAIAVTVALLAENWENVMKFVKGSAYEQDKYNKELAKTTAQTKEALEQFDLEEARLRSIGVAEKEIIMLRRQKRQEAIDAQRAELENQKKIIQQQIDEVTQQQVDAAKGMQSGNLVPMVYNMIFGTDVKDIGEAKTRLKEIEESLRGLQVAQYNDIKTFNDLVEKENEDKAAKLKEIEDERLRQLEINIEFEKMKIQQLIESHKSAFDEIKKGTDSAVSEIEGLRNKAFESINDTRTSNETKLNILKEYLQAGYITEKEYAEKSGDLEVQKIENQRQLANESFGILQNINTLAGENFEAQKGISIAQTGVDTYEAAQSIFKNAAGSPITKVYPAYPFVAAGLAITAGLARIKQMAQIRPGVRSFSGGGSTSTPSAPSFTPAQGTNVEGAGNVNLSSQANASRVYVLESDIRSTTSRVDVIQSNAMFK
jgi:hypothetical protein